MFNKKDLRYLLELLTGISAIAGMADIESDKLAKRFHYQQSRILLDAALRSTASFESIAQPRVADFYKLINNAIDVAQNADALARLAAADGTASARLELKRFLAQLGQVQIAPFEDDPRIALGRMLALLDTIPSREQAHIEDAVSGAKSVFQSPPATLLGFSLREAAVLYMQTLHYYAVLWGRFKEQISPGSDRMSSAIQELHRHALQQHWSFTAVSFSRLAPGLHSDAWLRALARTPSEHRALLASQPNPFEIGDLSCRMLTLDRFPIVALPNSRYIVPNITIFRKSFTHVLDYSLLDTYIGMGLGDLYNQVRGKTLEIYITEMVTDRFPGYELIPETEYNISRGAKRSPDLCILDTVDRTLIAIEAKARRLSPAAAALATDEMLDQNYQSMIDALRKLPEKVDDIYSAPEFSRWSDQLQTIPRNRAVLISVVPGSLFFHDEMEPLRASLDPDHPLAEVHEAFCFLDLAILERAVEIAHKHGLPLGQLFREHFEDSCAADFNSSAARQFRGRDAPPPEETFPWKFLSSQGTTGDDHTKSPKS